ncbi:DUF6879 family protein [Streptomyces sp. NPDC059755]|uniref:DUF6879 family protein n=1 Tax=Streptomyces sp. NPDC059755 TaxID=3346934 RepID=UPI00365A8218
MTNAADARGRRVLAALADTTPAFLRPGAEAAAQPRAGFWRRLLFALSDAAPAFRPASAVIRLSQNAESRYNTPLPPSRSGKIRSEKVVKRSWPRVPSPLLKVLLSVFIGGATYALTVTMDQPAIWKLTASVFLAGAALIIQYMADFDRRLVSVTDSREQELRVLSRLDEQLASVADLVSPGERPTSNSAGGIAQLLRRAAAVDFGGSEVVEGFVRREVSNLAVLVEGLSQKSVVFAGEDHDWIVSLTQSATRSIDAISSHEDRAYWDSGLGRRYLHAQLEAITAREVRIRRVFQVSMPEQIDDLREVVSEQQSLGIDVRVVALSQLPAAMRLGAFFDFVIFDQALAYEVRGDLVGAATITAIDLRDEVVARHAARFRELWEAAEQF